MNKIVTLAFFMLFFCSIFHARAQDNPSSSATGQPLEITADESLEWQRNEKLFIARKNAMAKQGDVSIKAQTLTARYREDAKTENSAGGGMEISEITAQDDVVIQTKDSEVHGQRAVYDLDKGVAVMTGDNPDNRAKMIRYNAKDQKNTLESDKISAILKDNNKGERVLHAVEAVGNVVITTPAEIITGAYGIYHAGTNKAELTGGVTIKRGPNILQGEKAEVDLNTNTSRMFGEPTTDGIGTGRVRGVFYPNSGEKAE